MNASEERSLAMAANDVSDERRDFLLEMIIPVWRGSESGEGRYTHHCGAMTVVDAVEKAQNVSSLQFLRPSKVLKETCFFTV